MFGHDDRFGDPDFKPLPEDEEAVLEKAAKWFNKWGAAGTVAGIMLGESFKPTNFILSQAMVFFEPMAQVVFNAKEYATFYRALEKRESVELFLQKLEALDAVDRKKETAYSKWHKLEKKNWKWYQRWLGLFPPKADAPDWVKNPPDDPQELERLIEQYKNRPDANLPR